jgi:hypothetical protein
MKTFTSKQSIVLSAGLLLWSAFLAPVIANQNYFDPLTAQRINQTCYAQPDGWCGTELVCAYPYLNNGGDPNAVCMPYVNRDGAPCGISATVQVSTIGSFPVACGGSRMCLLQSSGVLGSCVSIPPFTAACELSGMTTLFCGKNMQCTAFDPSQVPATSTVEPLVTTGAYCAMKAGLGAACYNFVTCNSGLTCKYYSGNIGLIGRCADSYMRDIPNRKATGLVDPNNAVPYTLAADANLFQALTYPASLPLPI